MNLEQTDTSTTAGKGLIDAARDMILSGPYYVSHQNDPDWKIV